MLSGRFVVPDSYGVMVKVELGWSALLGGECCGSLYSLYAAFISRCVW